MRATPRMLAAAIAVLVGAPAAHGQSAVPATGELPINETVGEQPATATLADSGFVVVWHAPYNRIEGRRYDAGSMVIGGDFQVNVDTVDDPLDPSVSALEDGFVVVWQSRHLDGDIQGRRFDAAGTAVGEQFLVSSYATGSQTAPSVATLAGGDFVATWTSYGSPGTDSWNSSIQGQRHAPDGAFVGSQFQVNSYTRFQQFSPATVALDDGGFVVLWTSYGSFGSDTSDVSVQGQRYGAGGMAAGEQFQVNSYTSAGQWWPSAAALDDGGFVVVWQGGGPGGVARARSELAGQRYSAGGAPLGGEFQVNSYTPDNQWYSAVSALDGGGFAVVWQSYGSTGSDTSRESIQARLYAADGSAVAGEFQVNTYTAHRQRFPVLAPLSDGGFQVAWQISEGYGPGSGTGVRGRRYAAPRYALTGLGGKCLDVEGAVAADGTPVNLYQCTGGDNQVWRLSLSTLPQRVVGLGGKCLLPGPIDTAGDVRAVIGECGDADLWRLTAPGHAQPSLLIHADTGLCLDVQGGIAEDGRPAILFDCHGGANQLWRPAATDCTQDSLGLCLNDERFRIDLTWRSFDGTRGSSKVVPRVSSDDSGLLWFFEDDNWEMLIKVLNGCHLNDRLWVFAAATTTVEYNLTVTDTATGESAEYFNPLGNAAAAITDTDAFATCSASAGPAAAQNPLPVGEASFVRSMPARFEGVCVPSETQLCLSGGRFSVEAEWTDYAGNSGSAQVVPAGSEDSGLLWFFDDNNWEVLIKVLDACDVNDRFWMLAAATTDVEYTLTVTDTDTGIAREYFNPLGNAAAALVDTFDTCP